MPSPAPETLRPGILSVLSRGAALWGSHAGRLFRLVLPFTLAQAVLGLLVQYGLYGTIVNRTTFAPESFLRPGSMPWDAASRPLGGPYPGPFVQTAGVLSIVAVVLLFLGVLTLLRALSLAFHQHGAPFLESVRAGAKRFGSAVMALLRQATYVLGWPILAFLLWFFGGGAVRLLVGEGTIRRALDASAPWIEKIVLALVVLFTLYRVLRSMFTLPALIDQGIGSKEALEESLRLTRHSLRYSIVGILVIAVITVVLMGGVTTVVGAGIGGLGRSLEATTMLYAFLLAVAQALLLPFLRGIFYVFYRSFLVLKGGRRV